MLFVTHDLDEAIYLSDRVVVLGARPGRMKRDHRRSVSRPRPDLPELRGDPEFQEIRPTMWELIRGIGCASRGVKPPSRGNADDRRVGGETADEDARPALRPAPTSRSLRRRAEKPALDHPPVSVVLVIGAWEVLGRQVDPLFMSYPSAIVMAGLEMIASGELVKGARARACRRC